MVGTAGEVLLPRPAVLHRQQLVDVGTGVEHRLLADLDATGASVDRAESGHRRAGGGFDGHGARFRGHVRCLVVSGARHWQTSHSGSSTEQAPFETANEPGGSTAGTALSLPSVPRSVLFSTWVAPVDRR